MWFCISQYKTKITKTVEKIGLFQTQKVLLPYVTLKNRILNPIGIHLDELQRIVRQKPS
jgi:hypothetical protein